MPPTFKNTVYIGPQRVLYLGASFDFDFHAHHAVQLCLGLHGPFEFASKKNEDPLLVRTVIVAPDVPHQISSKDAGLMFVYLDPESSDYSLSLKQEIGTQGFITWADGDKHFESKQKDVLREIETILSGNGNDSPTLLIDKVLLLFGIQASYQNSIDSRIQSVLKTLNQTPSGQCSIKELSQVSCLSPSRLQHLFREQVGIPIRRYSLWLRIRKVIKLILSGQNFTHAALEASFSDGAHFSRTFRDMFGIPPTALLDNTQQVSVHLYDAL